MYWNCFPVSNSEAAKWSWSQSLPRKKNPDQPSVSDVGVIALDWPRWHHGCCDLYVTNHRPPRRCTRTSERSHRIERFLASRRFLSFFPGRALNMYTGATMSNYRTQIVFNHTEDFMIVADESNNSIACWDTRTTEKLKTLTSGNIAKWLLVSRVVFPWI